MRAEAVASVGPGGRARLHLGPLGIRVLSVLLGLGAWEAYGQVLRSPIFTYPSAIVRAGVLLVRTGELAYYLQASLVVLAGGLFLAILFGIPFGVVMARSSLVEYATEPYMNALYATPTVALIPVIVLWLGFQTTAKVALVFLFCVFPILINTYQGVRSVDRRLVEVARSFCSGEWALWRDPAVRHTLPAGGDPAGHRPGVGGHGGGGVLHQHYRAGVHDRAVREHVQDGPPLRPHRGSHDPGGGPHGAAEGRGTAHCALDAHAARGVGGEGDGTGDDLEGMAVGAGVPAGRGFPGRAGTGAAGAGDRHAHHPAQRGPPAPLDRAGRGDVRQVRDRTPHLHV
ncbi:MAG: hypothetical protein C4303_00535 [candidate division GAL15 bacterium]